MKKKRLIVLIVLLAVLIGGCTYVLYGVKNKNQSYTTAGDASSKNTTQKTTSVPSSKSTDSTSSAGSTGSSVVIGTITPPSNDAPYPIINEHYRIDHTSGSDFEITLYAIINSPSQYDEYRAQLKQYKQEALSYLSARYGDISKFSFTWNPAEAKNL